MTNDDDGIDRLFDSGYTPAELEALFAALTKGARLDPDEAIIAAVGIGITDGDVLPLTDSGTVLLATPRTTLDRRVTKVRERLAAGDSLTEAIAAL